VGAVSLRELSRAATYHNQTGLAAIVEDPLLRSRFATLDAILVKHVFHYRIGRTAIPEWIVIEVQSDRRNRARADIRASPPAGGGKEFNSDLEIRMFHRTILTQEHAV